jgi:hypothetical protein
MLRRAVLVVGLGALLLLPTHARIVSAAADNPLQVWQVMDVGGQPAAGETSSLFSKALVEIRKATIPG